MANAENLIGHGFHEQTASEQRERARKGGKASGVARRRKKTMKDIAEFYGKMDAPPAVLANLVQNGIIAPGEVVSFDEALMLAQYFKALSGNTKAAQFVRDTGGQKPIDQVELNDLTAEQSKLDEILKQRRAKNDSK